MVTMLTARLTMILSASVAVALQCQGMRAMASELELHGHRTLQQRSVTMGEKTTEKNQVLTPGGPRPPSQVHEIAPGHVLDSSGGRLRELDANGNVVADFGPVPTEKGSGRPALPGKPGAPE
jgi:hypothetical protein